MDRHPIHPSGARVAAPFSGEGSPPRRFVTRGAKKPSPTRHKISISPRNLHEQKPLTPAQKIHTHPGKNASPASQASAEASGDGWAPKSPPHPSPDFQRRPQPQETEELSTTQNNTHTPVWNR